MTVTDVDLMQFANSARWLLEKLASREINGPITVGKNGQPIAVIIRAQAYTPKLDKFMIGADNNARPYIACAICPGFDWTIDNPRNLANALNAANQHWHDTHREPR